MSSKNLRELIRASGGAGIGGQSFKSNVTGAGQGVAMTSYNAGTPSSYDGLPQPPGEGVTYPSGTVFNVGVNWANYGTNFYHIRRNGTDAWAQFGTAQVTFNSVTWDDISSPMKSTVNLTVVGAYDLSTMQSLTGFFYTAPTPSGSEQVLATLAPVVVGAATPSGSDNVTLQLFFDPDTALFNATTLTSSFSLALGRRALPSWTTMHEWEVWLNGTYNLATDTPLGFNGHVQYSSPGETWNYQVRYRLRQQFGGTGTWTNFGTVSWQDPRPAM